jgi:hypothetical protein
VKEASINRLYHRISFTLKFQVKQKGSMEMENRIVMISSGGTGVDQKEESLLGYQNIL